MRFAECHELNQPVNQIAEPKPEPFDVGDFDSRATDNLRNSAAARGKNAISPG
jgi:hypothetical protein